MDKDTFIEQVSDLRRQGTSIRAIAAKLGVPPSRVQRALAKPSSPRKDTSNTAISHSDRESVFVGRKQELALLQQKLDEAMAGHGNLVFLSGEPGIGKTRLAEELCYYARTKQVSSYWGRCHEELQAPPFWPWIEILRAYIQQHRTSQLRSAMGPGAADIATIVPKLLQKLPEVEPALPLDDPSEDRFRLFDSMNDFFKRSSKRQPTLLIIDNLQWCDEPSLLLLRFISHELANTRILVVGSYRNVGLEHDHPMKVALGELSCQPSFQQMLLDGLNREETDQLVYAQGSFDSSKELMENLHERTNGNPLFIIHIVRSFIKEGSLSGQGSDSDLTPIDAVPDSLYMAISRNLAYLSPQCQEVLKTASAIGREFDLAILRQMIKELAVYELQDLLHEAISGGVITQSTLGRDRYQFTHALVQETLLRMMKASQRVELHARIGTTLEGIYANDLASVAASLAYHFGKSIDLTSHDKAIHYYMLAAEQALVVFAYEEAVRHFEHAMEIKQNKTPAAVESIPDDETAEILLGMAKAGAAVPALIMPKSFEPTSQLLNYYLDKKDVAGVIELAKTPMVILGQTSINELKKSFEYILNMVDPDSPEAGWLLSVYGYYLGMFGGEQDAAQDAFDRALDIARQNGDQHMEMRVLINSVQVTAAYWKADWDRVQQAVDIAKKLNEQQVETIGLFFSATFAMTILQRREAQDLCEYAVTAATKLRHHSLMSTTTGIWQILAQYYGDFQVSRLRSERAIKEGPACNIMCTLFRAITEYELGNLDEGDRFVLLALEDLEHAPASAFIEYGWASAQLPFIDYFTGRGKWPEIEDRVINTALSISPPETFFGIMARIGLGLRSISRSDIATAQQSYDILKGPLKSEPVRSMMPPIAMSSDRLLGLLCLTFEDYDRAIKHFQDAIDLCREWGFSPQLAWSCYDCSRAMLSRDNIGDKSKANTLASEALSIADELGMKLLSGRVRDLTDIKITEQAHPVDPYHFTGREIEILKLLALGRTNREIAQELFISVDTAATHVRNILNKGNLTNRTEAAALAARHYS